MDLDICFVYKLYPDYIPYLKHIPVCKIHKDCRNILEDMCKLHCCIMHLARMVMDCRDQEEMK